MAMRLPSRREDEIAEDVATSAEFSVWAPEAGSVEVVLGARRVRLDESEYGWWHAEVDNAGAGDDYSFSIGGGDPIPDPRSHFQPHGVHAPSQLVDHDTFGWTDHIWRGAPLAGQIVYEMHVGTFTPEGTFDGAIDRLDHLLDLGVTAVEVMPVAEFPGSRGWGYDGVDLYAVHHAYGGPGGFKRFVDECHARGLCVVLDVVYNHLGPDGNYLGSYGPYFSDKYKTPWGDAVNFDGPGSSEVRDFMIGNALHWFENYHVDGLRLDAVHAILDLSAMHFLEELAVRVEALSARLGKTLFLIAESDLNDPRIVRPREAGGYGIDAQWSDDFHHALHALMTGERDGYYADFGTVSQLAQALQQAFVYDGTYSEFRGRHHGRRPEGLSGHRFLAYLQNHDQIGNRAAGDRSGHLVSTDLLKVGAALVLTSPFVPMLFQGEEWGASTPFQYFTDHQDPDLGRAVSDGRRGEFSAFGWDPAQVPDPQDAATFRRSVLDWSETSRPPHADILEWHRALIALRRALPDLTDGRLDLVECRFDDAAGWLVMQRGSVAVVCNFSGDEITIPLVEVTAGDDDGWTILLASSGGDLVGAVLTLPAESAAVLHAVA